MKETNIKEVKYYIQKAEKYIVLKQTDKALEELDFALEKIKILAKENNINTIFAFEKLYNFEIDLNELIEMYMYQTIKNRPSEAKAKRSLAFIKSFKKSFKDDMISLDEYKARALYISNNKEEAFILLNEKVSKTNDINAYIELMNLYALENNTEKVQEIINKIEEVLEEDIETKIYAYENITSYYSKIKNKVELKKYTKKLNNTIKSLEE